VVKQNATLMHPKGKGHISLSYETLGFSNDKNNFLLRSSSRGKPRITYFDSYAQGMRCYKSEITKLISLGYFLPPPSNEHTMVDYDKSHLNVTSEKPSWNTMDRMPVDSAFFEEHFIRELHDGHHVLIKLCPSETAPFAMWDGRGNYILSDTLLSKLSMIHAYTDISGLTLSATLAPNGEIIINEVLDNDDITKDRLQLLETLRHRASASPLRFLRFATYYLTDEQWHHRSNQAAYASYARTSQFGENALKYYFPSGDSYRVCVKSLYEIHATSERGASDIALCLSKTPLLSNLNIGESFVIDGQRFFTQPMLSMKGFIKLTDHVTGAQPSAFSLAAILNYP
jgi:hypothetical protein